MDGKWRFGKWRQFEVTKEVTHPWQRAAKVCANLCAKKRARQAKTWWILLTNSVDAVETSFCWNHWMLSCLWMVRSYRKGDPPRPGRPFCWCPGEVRKIWWCERGGWMKWWNMQQGDLLRWCIYVVQVFLLNVFTLYIHKYISCNIIYIHMIMYIVSIFSQFLQCRFPMYLLSSTPVNPILWMNPPQKKTLMESGVNPLFFWCEATLVVWWCLFFPFFHLHLDWKKMIQRGRRGWFQMSETNLWKPGFFVWF